MRNVRRQGRTLLILLLMVFGFFGTVVVVEGQRTPDWQIAFARAVPGVNVVAATRAKVSTAFDVAQKLRLMDGGKMLALPEPPVMLYCVLGRQGKEEQRYFVAFYDDTLWHADWVIWANDRGLTDVETQQLLYKLGCD